MQIMVGNVPVELDLDADEMILDATVIVRTIKPGSPPGTTAASYGASDNMDRIVQTGLLYTALQDATNDLRK